MEQYREFGKHVYTCLIDYQKAFDSIHHNRFWNTPLSMGLSVLLIIFLRNFYNNLVAKVLTEFVETDQFLIAKGVRQGCVLSPVPYNLYTEKVIREVQDDYNGDIEKQYPISVT